MLSQQRKGELSAFGGAMLWGLFPIAAVVAVSSLPPLFTASIATSFSSLFFAALVTWNKRWRQLLIGSAWKDILLATFFIGIVYYGLVYMGYRFTSPGNGAIVSLMEIFFSFVIVDLILRHDKFVWTHAMGAMLMVLGALAILLPKKSGHWNLGDLLILCATAVSPFGNVYARKARKLVSADVMLLVRSVVSALFLFLLALVSEALPAIGTVRSSLVNLVLSGVFLLGLSKILWVESIHRVSIAKAVSLSAIEVFVTLLFAWILLGKAVTTEQAVGVVPMIGGIFLLVR